MMMQGIRQETQWMYDERWRRTLKPCLSAGKPWFVLDFFLHTFNLSD